MDRNAAANSGRPDRIKRTIYVDRTLWKQFLRACVDRDETQRRRAIEESLQLWLAQDNLVTEGRGQHG